MRERVFWWLDVLARLFLAGLFVYAAWSKLDDPAMFARSVEGYRLLPSVLSGWVAVALPAAELLAALALVLSPWPREAALLVCAMLGVFVAGLLQAWARGLNIGCGCFDPAAKDAAPLWVDALRDVGFLVPAVWVAVRPNRALLGRWSRIAAPVAAVLLFAVAAGLAVRAVVSEAATTGAETAPACPREGDFPAALEKSRADGRPLVAVIVSSGTCEFCDRLDAVLDGSLFGGWAKRNAVRLVFVRDKDVDPGPSAKAATDFFIGEDTRKIFYPQVGVFRAAAEDGRTVRTKFLARQGHMPSARTGGLAVEFLSALDRTLAGEYVEEPDPALVDRLPSPRHVAYSCEGGGTVRAIPASCEIRRKSGKVVLTAVQQPGFRFAGWRGPGLAPAQAGSRRLSVTAEMSEGPYVAVFQKQSEDVLPESP